MNNNITLKQAVKSHYAIKSDTDIRYCIRDALLEKWDQLCLHHGTQTKLPYAIAMTFISEWSSWAIQRTLKEVSNYMSLSNSSLIIS